MKLNLGCGPVHIDGELGVDLYKTEAAEVIADLLHLPFANQTAEFIRLDHVLEHFSMRDCVRLILECKRVLKINGVLKVGVPDLEVTMHEYLNTSDVSDRAMLLRSIYGSQTHDGEYHKSGWDCYTLSHLLKICSLDSIQIEVETNARMEGSCISIKGTRYD